MPLLSYWEGRKTQEGAARGTTWTELTRDFQSRTGIQDCAADKWKHRKDRMAATRARNFALATGKFMSLGGCDTKFKFVTGLRNVTGMGAQPMAGIAPAVLLDSLLSVGVALLSSARAHVNKVNWRWQVDVPTDQDHRTRNSRKMEEEGARAVATKPEER